MHVYFLEAAGCWPPVVKIGISSDVARRMNAIQTSMPFKLQFMGCVSHPSMSAARAAERKLHKKLKAKRLQGEWFKLTPKTRQFIVALVGANISIPAPMPAKPKFDHGLNYETLLRPAVTRGKNGRFLPSVPSRPQ